MTACLHGIPVSDGIVICQATVFTQSVCSGYAKTVDAGSKQKELARFREALAAAIEELEKKQAQAEKIGKVQAEIISAHLMIMQDRMLAEKIEALIQENSSAEYAVEKAIEEFTGIFEAMEDEYMRERAGDIRDIGRRLLMILTGQTNAFVLDRPTIVVAEDLMPSDTALFDQRFVLGMATAKGGKTSHTAILARTMGIPAVVGAGDALSVVKTGDLVIVDGAAGQVFVNPEAAVVKKYEEQARQYQAYRQQLASIKHLKNETLDGKSIELAANIGKPDELPKVLEMNADGIGLFRTEFLFMGQDKLPTEEDQFLAYKAVLEALPNKRVIIRTLDAGGDKELCYLNLAAEENPALGLRAIRLCLSQQALFKIQLRALLRASVYGRLQIMFPMIAELKELRKAKQLLREAEQELAAEGKEFAKAIPVGIMIEIPAAAIMAEVLAKEVDFFSIGTNDLVQYTMAVDRMNNQLAYLNDYFNPAVLRLIANTCKAAKKAGIFVGMCGEMASDKLAIPLLIGMGLDELSMNPGSILQSKDVIRRLSCAKASTYVEQALQLTGAEEVRQYCQQLASVI